MHATTDTEEAGISAIIALPTTPAGMVDSNTNNNSASSALRSRNAAANLSATVTATEITTPQTHCPDGTGSYTPGCAATYTVEIANAGPDAADGATLTTLARSEAGGAAFEWACAGTGGAACPSASGSEALSDVAIATFPKDGKLTYTVTVAHIASELFSQAGIKAGVAAPTGTGARVDIDHSDNEDEALREIDRRAALRVVKRALQNGDPITQVSANVAFDYEITVYNDGPSDVGNTVCDPDESSCDPFIPLVDTTGPALVLTDEFDELLAGVAGSCSPSGGSPCWTLCPTTFGWEGEGDDVADAGNCPVDVVTGSADEISQRFSLNAGSGSRLFTRVNVPSVAVATAVVNEASVAVSSCGGVSTCHAITLVGTADARSDDVSVTILPASSASIEVVNKSGADTAIPGTSHSYLITVTNTGFHHLPGTVVQSSFPVDVAAGFVPGTVFHTCRAYGNACCFSGGSCGLTEATPATYTNALAATSNLPANSRVEYTITGMLDPRATADVALEASAQISGIPQPVQDNVSTTMTPQRNLTLSKRLYQRIDENDTTRLFYEIIAGNNGPSFAPEALLTDDGTTVPAPTDFDFADANWSCEALPAPAPTVAPEATLCGLASGTHQGVSGLPLDLMPGGRAVIRLDVPVTLSAGNQVINRATLSLAGSGTRTAEVTTSLRANYTLAVEKDDGLAVAHPGAAHTYSITVLNEGPDDAYDVRVRDVMPSALQNVQWTCSAVSPVPGDLQSLQDVAGPTPHPGHMLRMSPDGRHVYVASRAAQTEDDEGNVTQRPSTLFAYQRNATPGLGYGEISLDPIDIEFEGVDDTGDTGSTVEGMEEPIDLVLSPDGAALYVLSASSRRIATFQRVTSMLDPEFGRLSFAGYGQATMSHPRRIVVSATHVYVAGSDDVSGADRVEVFRPNVNSRVPEVVPGPAVAAPVAAGPMLLDAAGDKLFVASTTTSVIARYSIAPSGPNAGSLSHDTSTAADRVHFQGIGDMVLAGNGRDIYVHARNGTAPRIGHVGAGTESLWFGSHYGENSASLLDGAVRLALSPDGEHLIGVNPAAHAMFSLRRNPVTGALTGGSASNADVEQQLFRADVIGLDEPTAVVVSPDNRHVLVASGSTAGAIGPLAVLSRRAPAPQLGFIELDRHGDAIPNTQGTIDSLIAPTDTAVRGRYVYAISRQSGAINLFERRLVQVGLEDEDGGHLSFKEAWRNDQGGITGMAYPDRVLISPDGKSLFVSSRDGDSLAVFSRDESDGRLTFIRAFQRSGGQAGLLGAFGMAMDSASQYLYVAGSYEAAIAIFKHDGSQSGAARLTYEGAVVGGQNGVTGMDGIRDLVVAEEGTSVQLLGVSETANTVVVFTRNTENTNVLGFVHALSLGAQQRPLALALSPGNSEHVYVAAQNSHTLHVLQRVLDSTSPQFGRVRPLTQVVAGGLAPARMTGPRDVAVSADGKRVYVVAEWGDSLVAFDRYGNAGSALYGQLAFAEIRTQDIDAVNGIASPYAVAVSPDSRNVYVAGFDSDALASFSVGTGSSCSASGSGDIDDTVTIRAGGAVMYAVQSTIRPDARDTLFNIATATGEDATAPETCSPGDPPDPANPRASCAADETQLLTSAQLELHKTNDQISVVPGTVVTYDVTVRNTGPGNVTGLADAAAANVTDLFGCTATGPDLYDCDASPFDILIASDVNNLPGMACEGLTPGQVCPDADRLSWTCAASGSGVLDFLGVYQDYEPGVADLGGIGSLALIPLGSSGDGSHVRDNFLVGASVDDDALVFFQRDSATGALIPYLQVNSTPTAPIEGARSVTVSQDGRLLFVASRRSDSLVAFELSGSEAQPLIVTHRATMRDPAIPGLDQALHVIALPAAGGIEHVYVAGANDHAVAAFAYNRAGNALSHIGSLVNGDDNVQGLADVEYLVASPDAAHVYALSGSGASVAQLNRDAATGELSYVARFTGGAQPLTGVSSASFDAAGKYLYLTVSGANRLAVFARVTAVGAGNYGSLSPVASLAQGEQGTQGLLNPRRAALSADGQHLYVTSQAGATLAWFSLHPETGVPSYQGIRSNQSAGVQGLSGATGLVLDPQLNQIYVAGTLDRAITHFQRQSDSWCPPAGTGLLDAVPVNIAAGGQVAFRISVRVSSQLSGNLVNIANASWHTVSSDSQCEAIPGTSLRTCTTSATDEDVPSNLADLSITKDDGLAEFDGLAGAAAIAADPRNIYVAAAGDNGIGMFQRQTSAPGGMGLRYLGALRSGASGVSGLAGVVDIRASADSQHVYAASPVDNAVASFARHPVTGRLTQIDLDQNGLLGVSGLSGARALAMNADGEHVYVAGGFSNSVAIFRRQTDTASADFGKLTFRKAVQAGVEAVNGIESPLALTLSGDGKHLYVLGGAGDTLVAFSRLTNSNSENFGYLTQIGRYQNATAGVLGMDEVRSLVLSTNGEHLYVLGAEAGSLVHFSRNADTGALTFVPHAVDQAVLLSPELVGAARLRMGDDDRLYVAASAQDAIAVFELDADGKPALAHVVRNGDVPPDPSLGLVDGLAGVADVAFVDDGAPWLYAGAAQDAALTAFALANGEPGYLGAILDGLGGVAPGDEVTYTIIVSNHGPSDVLRARVVDSFPPEFEQVSWICSGYADGECSPDGVGNLDLEVKLPNGSHVQFEATGIVGAKASGRLINTATVQAIGVLDPNMENNSATDDDTVLSPSMDLSIAVDDNGCDLGAPGCEEVTQATPGGDIAYRVLAANAGPTYAQDALVSDTLPAALYDTTWTCTPTPYAGLLEEIALADAEFDTAYRALAVDTLGRHVYAVGTRSDADGERDTVVAFIRDPLTGVLTRLRSWSDGEVAPTLDNPAVNAPPVRGIRGAIDIAITADGRFVYVAGHDADAIAVFARDTASGLLEWRSQVVDGELGVDGIGGISALALSPDGRHLYAGGASDHAIAAFDINITSGALSPASVIRQGNGVNGLNGVNALAFDAGGSVLFATADANRSVAAFRRTIADGVLAYLVDIEDGQVGVSASLLSPSAVAVHEDRVFVADAQGDAVNLLRFVDGEEPAFELDEVLALDADGTPATQSPQALVFVPDQMRLYVGASTSGQIHLYSLLDAAGAQPLETYDIAASAALDRVAALAISPNGRQLYAASGGDDGLIATLAREPGSRCPLAGAGGLGSQRVDIAPGGFVRFDVTGRIFANATGTLTYAVAVDPRVLAHESQPIDNRASDTDTLVPAPDLETRKLRETPDAGVVAGLPVSWRIEAENHGVSDALGAWMTDTLPLFPDVVAGLLQDSGEWTCDANLPLTTGLHLGADVEPRIAGLSALAHTADGRRWFGVSRSGNALVELRLDAAGDIESVHRLVDGDEDAGGEVISGLSGASHLALSPDGASLYVTAASSNSVLTFAIVPDGLYFVQKLTSGSDGVAGVQGAIHVVVSGDGRFVYTAAVPTNVNNSAIALFRRDADSGELSFVERIQDGLGTFQPDVNVIRGVRRLHLTEDGRHLYAVSTVSQSLVRFEVDANSGTLRYVGVLRSADTPALAGARDLVATPGDGQLYVLGDQGIALFPRALNGSLTLSATTPSPDAAPARALAMDTWGARLYLADAQGAVHLYARQWSDGTLEHRFTLSPANVAEPGALLHLPPLGEVLLAQAGTEGGLARLHEQAVSRCMAAEGIESELPAQIDLGVGGSSQLHYTATVHPSARGTLRNVASTIPGAGVDPNPANDESIDEATILVESDLSISKQGPENAVAGEYIDYVITVTNAGPSNALGIQVIDALDPVMFANASWTCITEGEGESFCHAASGAGATLDVMADLHVGDELVVTLHVQVHPAFIGTLYNAAKVVPEIGSLDPNPGDNEVLPVETEVVRRPDLSVSKSNGVTEVVAGLPVSYTIAVSNLGPSDAPEARVQDFLPVMLRDASWTCTTTLGTGDCGAASGQGSINRVVSIPAGETLTWQLHATLRSSALGELTNTASALVLGDALDPVPGNNSASDTDTIVTRADLSLAVEAPDAYDPASTQPMPYRIDVGNAGPSDARDVVVTIQFSHAFAHNTAECTPPQGNRIDCTIESVAAGGTASIALGLRQLPSAPNILTSSLDVSSQTDDPVPGNNTATSSTVLRTGVDMEVRIDDGRIGFAPGDTTRYTIRVRNIGSVDAVNARVLVPIAALLVDATWQCSAPGSAVCSASGSGDIDDLIDLPAGATLTYTLDATLDPGIDVLLHHSVAQTVQVNAHGGQVEVSTLNNNASDINLIFKVIFRDGFEDEPEMRGVRDEPQAALVPPRALRWPGAAAPFLPAHAALRRFASPGPAAIHRGTPA